MEGDRTAFLARVTVECAADQRDPPVDGGRAECAAILSGDVIGEGSVCDRQVSEWRRDVVRALDVRQGTVGNKANRTSECSGVVCILGVIAIREDAVRDAGWPIGV